MESQTTGQHFECPACGSGPMRRLGDFMNHIERECGRLSVAKLDEIRDEKLSFAARLQTLTQSPIKHDYSTYVKGVQPVPQQLWSDEECDRLLAKEKGKERVANKEGWEGTSTSNQENARPAAPFVIYGADLEHPHHPAFDATRYYSAYSGRYHCPKPHCQKGFPRAGGLVGHLLSPAHSDRSYRCPTCLASFKSLTAIASHVESAGAKCGMRHSDKFDAYVDQLAAGLVEVEWDRAENGSPVYHVTKKARDMFAKRVSQV